jgi:hypothetical protein
VIVISARLLRGFLVVTGLGVSRGAVAQQVDEPVALPWRAAVQTEAAIGIEDRFYNHLAGARFERAVTSRAAIGGYFAYANLKGKSGRAHNVLPAVSFAYRLPLASSWWLPLRYTGGYLPKNGPVVRLSGGVLYEAGRQWDLAVDLLAPTLWITQDTPVLSLDLALEAGFRF